MKKSDIGVIGVIYAICLGFLYMTLQLPQSTQIYPLFILGVIFILATLYLITMIKGYREVGIISQAEEFEGFIPKQFFVILGLIVLYIVILHFLGFYISTVLFMAVALLYLRVPYIHTILTIVVICLIVYFAFTQFLGVRLPEMTIF